MNICTKVSNKTGNLLLAAFKIATELLSCNLIVSFSPFLAEYGQNGAAQRPRRGLDGAHQVWFCSLLLSFLLCRLLRLLLVSHLNRRTTDTVLRDSQTLTITSGCRWKPTWEVWSEVDSWTAPVGSSGGCSPSSDSTSSDSSSSDGFSTRSPLMFATSLLWGATKEKAITEWKMGPRRWICLQISAQYQRGEGLRLELGTHHKIFWRILPSIYRFVLRQLWMWTDYQPDCNSLKFFT